MKTMKKKTTNSKSPKSKATLVDREYIVEEIKGKRFYEGETQFFVKWEGFEAECSTWEPMQNLGKCIHLLAKYENDVYLRNLERSVDEKENMKLNASQGIEVQNNGCSTPVKPQPGQEPKQKLRNDWKKKCLRLSDSSDDEPSPAFESITPPLLNQPKSRRQLLVSSASSSASCSSSASFSSSTSSSFASAQPTQPQSQPVLPTKQSPPQPVIPTKQSRSQLQPVLPTNKQKVKFGDILEAAKKHRKDSGKKLSTNTEKTRANYSLEDAEDCNTPERIWDEEEPAGLKLERVIHSFRMGDDLYLVVKWMGCDEPDAVQLQEIRELYPNEIVQYFQSVQRRNDDLVNFNSNEPDGNINKSHKRQEVQGQHF